jgi:uncharacterized protein
MKREQIISILKLQKPHIKERFGVNRLGIFGSIARDEAREGSDVDVVVEMDPDLFRMVHLKELLEESFQAPVHVVRYRSRMNQFLKARIEKEAVYV